MKQVNVNELTKVAVFGGNDTQTYVKVGKKQGFEVTHHKGKSRNGGSRKVFEPIIRKADCVVMLHELGHVPMDIVKEVCKDLNVPFVINAGISGALQKSKEVLAA